MYKGEKIIAFAEKNKSIVWGLFLSTIIFRHAIGNIFLAILLVIFFIQVIQKRSIDLNKNLIPVVVYFLWGMISLIWTTDFQNTIKGIGITLPLILTPVFISQYSYFGTNDLIKTIKFFSVGLVLYFVFCTLNAGLFFIQDHKISHFFYHNLVSLFDNNAIYISLAVATCILFIFNIPKKRVSDYLLLFILGIFLLVLASKNLIITTFLLIGLSSFKNKIKFKTGVIISVVLMLTALMIVFIENPLKLRFQEELNLNPHHVLTGQDFYDYKFNGMEVRLFQWRLMGEMINNHQVGILGLGLHNVDYLLAQYFSYYNLYKGYFQINFHNQFLQTIGVIGFIGLVLLLSIFARAIYVAIKSKNTYETFLVLLFLSSFFTESFLSRQKGVIFFATLVSLILSFPKEKFQMKS